MLASEPVLVVRPASLAKLVVLTAFDASFSRERKGRSQGGLITTVTAGGVENEPTVCTTVEFHCTVIHREI